MCIKYNRHHHHYYPEEYVNVVKNMSESDDAKTMTWRDVPRVWGKGVRENEVGVIIKLVNGMDIFWIRS